MYRYCALNMFKITLVHTGVVSQCWDKRLTKVQKHRISFALQAHQVCNPEAVAISVGMVKKILD